MKSFFLFLLQKLAQAVIRRHKPFVVAVTGTVWKSTATHFLFDALEVLYGRGQVFMSFHNYNWEYGVPFTILQTASPHSNPILWAWVFIKGIALLFTKNYPKYLVLEYGIDHPGEMDMLLNIAEPDVGVLLAISKNHVANFASYDEYVAEKLKLVHRCKALIYNGDDAKIRRAILDKPREETYSFGRKSAEPVDFRATQIVSTLEGLTFDVESGDLTVPVKVPVVGGHQAYNILVVFALARVLGKDIHEVTSIFEHLHPQKGRGSILHGVNETTILDGSYNGSHEAITAGIEYLQELDPAISKALFLGDMRELGADSREMHEDLIDRIVELNPVFIVLVGEEMRKYVVAALKEKMGEDRVFHYANSRVAGQKIRELLYEIEGQKAIFVKGSQNTIFLEEGIKEFLFDMRDTDNLCRQSPRWLKKKSEYFDLIALS